MINRCGKAAKTPALATAVDRALAHQARSAFSSATIHHFSGVVDRNHNASANIYPIQIRNLSLQALDMAAVRQIKAELMSVDANSDGRYARRFTFILE